MSRTIAETEMDLSVIGPIVGSFGIVVVLISTLDFVMTTLTVSTNGYLTSSLALLLHRIGLYLFRFFALCKMKRVGHYVFSSFGVITLISMIIFWVGSLWIGWTMIFFWNERAVVRQDQSLQVPVTLNLMGDLFLARIYFVGVTFITLGYGDVIPSTNFFRILATILGVQGILTIGAVGTLIINIVSTLARARTISVRISHMGFCPSKLIISSWNGEDFHAMEAELSQLSFEITAVIQTLGVHPMLCNYHSLESDHSLVTRVAALDEALTAMEHSMDLGLGFRSRPLPLDHVKQIVEANKPSEPPETSSCISINATSPPASDVSTTSNPKIPYKLNCVPFHLCRNTITHFIHTLKTYKMASVHVRVPDLPIDEPTWEVMKAHGFPLKYDSYQRFKNSFSGNEKLDMRRRVLHSMVHYDGRSWRDVIDDKRSYRLPAITPEPEFA